MPKWKSPGACMAAGTSHVDQLGGEIDTENKPNLSRIQSSWLARRFGLPEQRASLVAALALAGGA